MKTTLHNDLDEEIIMVQPETRRLWRIWEKRVCFFWTNPFMVSSNLHGSTVALLQKDYAG